MPICIVCAECLPVRNGQAVGGELRLRFAKTWPTQAPSKQSPLPANMEASRAAGDGLHPAVGSRWHPHGRVLEGGLGAGAGRGKAAPPQPPSLGRPHGLGVACVGLVLAARVRRGTPVGRLSGGLRCCVRPMPICIVCAECLPVRNGKPSGACFDCDLLKHGQHKPRPSKGWSSGPLMLVGLPPHKRTDAGAGRDSTVGGACRRLVACDAEISSLWWAKCRQSRFWVRLLVARCLRTWRRQGRPATACTPDRRLPVAPTQGGCGRRRRLLPATPRSVARGWRSVGKSPACKAPARELGFLLLGSQLVLRPESSCLPGHAWACLLPFAAAATLECVVGRRALACLLGHCVRNGRVSGDWRVWACWIPARAGDNIPASPLQSSAQARSCLGRGRFPVLHTHREGIPLSRTSRFPPCAAPLGAAARVDLKAPAVSHVPRTAARPGSLAIASSPRSLDAEHTVGTRLASVCPRKQAFGASCERRPPPFWARPMRAAGSVRNATCYSLFDGTCYSDNRSNSRANTCNKPRLLEGMHLLDKRSTRAPPVAAMIHDNSTDRTALVPATHHSNFCPINFR
ncbi:UNVERIFIED_CONTAM: hypothetical protein Sindi_3089300, partial [Sesamum indicum]